MMCLNSNAHLNPFHLNQKDLESKTILPKIFCNMHIARRKMHIAIESILPLTYMQKEDSLSFPMVLGSRGGGLSLVNKICVGAKWLRLWFLWSFNVIWKLCSMWFEINVHNNSYVFFYDSKNYSMLWQAVISWSFYCDEAWFTEVYHNLP